MKYHHKHDWIFNLGGFLWWLIICFGRTKLEDEQKHKNDFRNFCFVAVIVLVIVKLTIYN